jgi:hypothetical protein
VKQNKLKEKTDEAYVHNESRAKTRRRISEVEECVKPSDYKGEEETDDPDSNCQGWETS